MTTRGVWPDENPADAEIGTVLSLDDGGYDCSRCGDLFARTQMAFVGDGQECIRCDAKCAECGVGVARACQVCSYRACGECLEEEEHTSTCADGDCHAI